MTRITVSQNHQVPHFSNIFLSHVNVELSYILTICSLTQIYIKLCHGISPRNITPSNLSFFLKVHWYIWKYLQIYLQLTLTFSPSSSNLRRTSLNSWFALLLPGSNPGSCLADWTDRWTCTSEANSANFITGWNTKIKS